MISIFEPYRIWYESTLGISITEFVRRDFAAEPLLYLAVVFTLGLTLGMALARWRWAMWLALPLVVLVSTLIGHIFTLG